MLSLCLQPDEGIHLTFEVKVPDQGMRMRSKNMEFHYESAFESQAIPEAYERLLQDALEGDPSLFIRSDHIEEAWSIVEPLLKNGESQGRFPPRTYEPGSWGPDLADQMLYQDGRSWLRVCGVHGSIDAWAAYIDRTRGGLRGFPYPMRYPGCWSNWERRWSGPSLKTSSPLPPAPLE